ncbi:MAG: sialate O-acetylesterase [Prevotella sp.]|nr:sialate O-acetylesterase [Prevotella sp.]
MKRVVLLICFFCASICLMRAEVKLPKFFGSNMVLQQQTDCNLWGTATAGKVVKVKTSWDGETYQIRASHDGKWQLQVKTPSAGGPYSIAFNDGKETRLDNIMVGEVWICSGQSNMEMQMKGFKAQPVEGATEELLHCKDAGLRLFTVKRNSQFEPVDTVSGAWFEANSASVRDFSATAYFFGKSLRAALDVPVGLIVTSWGGSACEAWMTSEWLQAFPNVKIPQQADDIKSKNRTPTVLYNGMLHPLVGYTMRGVIWYQGEDNVNRADYYADLLSTMIRGWRAEWQQGDFPFYYCQIAPYDYSLIDWNYNSALLREQQARVETIVDNARMAVLMDAGLEYGIHPRKKRLAGERLALLALANTYAIDGLPEFACYSNVEFRGDTAVVAFDRSKEWVYFNNGQKGRLFEIAGADKVFHPAEAWVERNRVYVKSDSVKQPVAVRYAFKNWADGDLFHDGLPVSSFRTDNWNE